MRLYIAFLFVFFTIHFSTELSAQDEIEYVTAVARPGDGVNSLLKLYGLDKSECNKKHFYKINKMKTSTGLRANRAYNMPIYIYAFNGKSIRTTIKNNDYQKAVRIQKYNEAMERNKLQHKQYKNTKILWVPHHELNCKAPTNATTKPIATKPPKTVKVNTPTASSSKLTIRNPSQKVYPIFGAKYKNIKKKSTRLAGHVFYLVSGHGGPDPGAVGKKNGKQLCEDEYAYDVMLRTAKLLIEQGATVYPIVEDKNDGIRNTEILPCDYDEQCWKGQKIYRQQKARLVQRSSMINKLYKKHKRTGAKSQRVVMIHVDSRTKGQRIDVFFYHHKDSRSSKKLAKNMHETFKAKYKKHQPNRNYTGTISARNLHMLEDTYPTAVYVELGNIQNKNDQYRFIKWQNRQALAKWLYEGMLRDVK